jgi:hypothetical protein
LLARAALASTILIAALGFALPALADGGAEAYANKTIS